MVTGIRDIDWWNHCSISQ